MIPTLRSRFVLIDSKNINPEAPSGTRVVSGGCYKEAELILPAVTNEDISAGRTLLSGEQGQGRCSQVKPSAHFILRRRNDDSCHYVLRRSGPAVVFCCESPEELCRHSAVREVATMFC